MKKTRNIKEIEKDNGKDNKKEIVVFLKEHIISKTKILSIIGIITTILVICLFTASDMSMVDEIDSFAKTSIVATLKERIIILLLILLAGWVPYFYIPAIAYMAYIFMLSGDVLVNMELNGVLLTLIINCIPTLIDVFTVSVIGAIGIYMCNYTTKKYRYTQRTSFSFLDVKIQFYEMAKKQDKYEEAIALKEKKAEEMKKNDVKIDYVSILKIAPVVIMINLLISVVQYFIN